MPYQAPPWQGERYCLGCHLVCGGVGEDGFCPECAAAWEAKLRADTEDYLVTLAKAKAAMPGLSDRQLMRMMRKGRFIG